MRSAAKRTAKVKLKPKSKRRQRGVDKPLVSPKFEVLPDGAHAVTIPVHTECFVNGSQGMSRSASFAAARAKKKQRETLAHYFFGVGVSFRGVTMVRLAPSPGLDTGNLWNALKGVQDEIAAHLDIDDGPNSPASWDVAQERAEAYGVRVELRLERAKSREELEDDVAYWKKMYLTLTNQVRRVEYATEVLRGLAESMGDDDRKSQGLIQAANDVEAALRGAA